MTTVRAFDIQAGIAEKHAKRALEIAAIDLQDNRRTELLMTAIESLQEAITPKQDLIETMEAEPNA